MIYFLSDPYVYSFENLYPLYLKFLSEGIDCRFDALFGHQGGNIPQLYKKFSGTSNLSQIRNNALPKPQLVIINYCWTDHNKKLINEFKQLDVPTITLEHGSPMLYYGVGNYRSNIHGSVSHPVWGKTSRDIMVKLGCDIDKLPILGSPRIDHYFTQRPKNTNKNNNAVIFGTKKEGTKPWSVDIETKMQLILNKHDNVKFKGKVLGPMTLGNLQSISRDFSSDDFYDLFNDIGHAYFWFPSSLITIAKVMGCKTYALYSDSHCQYTLNYFKDNKSHILAYDSTDNINDEDNKTFLHNNLEPNGIDNTFNYIVSNFLKNGMHT